MTSSLYPSPYRGYVRSLERNIMKYRAMQMVLIIHYAEQIKEIILMPLKTANGSLNMDKLREGTKESPKKKLKPIEKATDLWKSEGLLTEREVQDIKRLIDFRNDVAHRVHLLAADLSAYRFVRDMQRFTPHHLRSYNYGAVDEMKRYMALLNQRLKSARWIIRLSSAPMIFESAERALHLELDRLHRRIDKLWRDRLDEQKAIQAELDLIHANFKEDEAPGHPYHSYDNGRLTRRGVEIFYRLFDAGHSTLAVAYAMGLSTKSTRNRHKKWAALGGSKRPMVSLEQLPIRPFQHHRDD